MCGRLDVDGEAIDQGVRTDLGILFSASTNRDLKPTQKVSTVAMIDNQLQQLDTRWGIKPAWATNLLINAKSETILDKQTFVKAFADHRCLVPCCGFYEWMGTKKSKVKLRFHHQEKKPLYMAAIWYPTDTPEVVTLTRAAPMEYRTIHHRFPVFIDPAEAHTWFSASTFDAQAMTQEWEARKIMMEPAE